MPKAIVLGGYGLIGAACLRALTVAGFHVTGVGRDAAAARRVLPGADWVIRDIATLTEPGWRDLLDGVDVVVNAAGALQDGLRDDLEAIHVGAVSRLVAALADSPARLVQISAAGVSLDAPTAFFRTKARGDALIMQSAPDWVILRPVLVIAPAAYGGTALLRAAACLPLAPRLFPAAPVRTVHIDDLAKAVVQAARQETPAGTLADITEPDSRSLPDTIAALRHWLGFPPARWQLPVPRPALRMLAAGADAAGWLGWRPPLRSSALRTLEHGVTGDPAAWRTAGGHPCRSLPESLAAMPATVQDRWFARLYLAFPAMVLLLASFWLASGLIALARIEAAQAVLTARSLPAAAAMLTVTLGAAADILLGAAILWRRWTRMACLGMAALATGYLAGGTLVAPDLWADPLGVYAKVLPGIGLALVTSLLAEDR